MSLPTLRPPHMYMCRYLGLARGSLLQGQPMTITIQGKMSALILTSHKNYTQPLHTDTRQPEKPPRFKHYHIHVLTSTACQNLWLNSIKQTRYIRNCWSLVPLVCYHIYVHVYMAQQRTILSQKTLHGFRCRHTCTRTFTQLLTKHGSQPCTTHYLPYFI